MSKDNDNASLTSKAILHPKVTLQLFTDEKSFGPGVALLLEKIKEKNSIRKATFDIGMSYSKAWTIIKRAEKNLGIELLVSKTGGSDGGSATLTEDGERVLKSFRDCEKELFEFTDEKFLQHFSWVIKNSQTEK